MFPIHHYQLIGLLSLLVVIYGSPDHIMAKEKQAPVRGGTLVFANLEKLTTFDPAEKLNPSELRVITQIYEGLVTTKSDNCEIIPALATYWQSDSQCKQWVFHLRFGVDFHDGTPFDADSVVHTFTRQKQKNSNSYRLWFNNILSITALDEFTVRFILRESDAAFLSRLTLHQALIVNKNDTDYSSAKNFPTGTGPFSFFRWVPGEKLFITTNKNHWQKAPFLKRVLFRYNNSPETAFSRLKQGTIDGMPAVSVSTISRYSSAKKQINFYSTPGLNLGYLALNTQKPPLNDKRVRRAIGMSINREMLVGILYGIGGVKANTLFPSSLLEFTEEKSSLTYDPVAAKKLLTKAGYPDGFAMNIYNIPQSRDYLPKPHQIARLIKGFLKKISINCRILTYEWDGYHDQTEKGRHDACLAGWTTRAGDPYFFLNYLLHKDQAQPGTATNLSFFRSDSFSDLLDRAVRERNPLFREELYQKALSLADEEMPLIPLAHARLFFPFRTRVKNFVAHPTGRLNFSRLWVEE